MDSSRFDGRPVVVAIAGPNGAGKTTFFHSQLREAALPFVNSDVLADELNLDAYAAARLADALRREFVRRRESFAFETVFSDPAGDKLAFLKEAAASGYTVVLCFIGIDGPVVSEQRVSMRVSQGGHDVPFEKLRTRYPRTIENLRAAVRELPHVLIYDNNDLNAPYRQIAVFENGHLVSCQKPVPVWLEPILSGLE
jgi:predicted ABC-type ATPase